MSKRPSTTDTRPTKRTRTKRTRSLDITCSLGICYASHMGEVEAVKQLLASGVSPTVVNGNGQTPLHAASCSGNTETVRLLLEDGTYDPNQNDDELQTPLMAACAGGFLEIVRLLMSDERVDPTQSDYKGITPFMNACGDVEDFTRGGFLGIVRLLLSDERVDPGRPDFEGNTPLMLACMTPCQTMGNPQGTHICYNNFCEECTEWMTARDTEQIQIIRLLLTDERVDPNQSDEEGATALLHCCEREDIMSLLLADERVERKQVCMAKVFATPLHIACIYGWTNIVRLLLNTPGYNYKIKAERVGTRTPFQLALRHCECTKLFLTLTTHLLFARKNIATDLASEVCTFI